MMHVIYNDEDDGNDGNDGCNMAFATPCGQLPEKIKQMRFIIVLSTTDSMRDADNSTADTYSTDCMCINKHMVQICGMDCSVLGSG